MNPENHLNELLSAPEVSRDETWEKSFLEALKASHLQVLIPEPQMGPDGFSYLLVSPQAHGNNPFGEVMQWLAQRGIGMVVNPQKEPYPDYVFSFGTVWNYCERGEFFSPQPPGTGDSGTYEIKDQQEVLVGPPSDGYIPPYVRSLLRQFFLDQGVIKPQWAMMSLDAGKTYDLVFSWESLGKPPEKEHDGILEAISWFLPSHYTLGMVSSQVIPQFYDIQ
jgi:hypothetical protein